MAKLVRDNIPEIVQSSRRAPMIRQLADADYRDALNVKLSGEVAELHSVGDRKLHVHRDEPDPQLLRYPQFLRYSGPMSSPYEQIRSQLAHAEAAETAAQALQHLRLVLTGVGELLDEQLARAVVDDEMSLAAAGKNAGLTENAVGPRLANTARLAPYVSTGGRVTAEDVKRARYDKYARTPLPPAAPPESMRFKPRRHSKPS